MISDSASAYGASSHAPTRGYRGPEDGPRPGPSSLCEKGSWEMKGWTCVATRFKGKRNEVDRVAEIKAGFATEFGEEMPLKEAASAGATVYCLVWDSARKEHALLLARTKAEKIGKRRYFTCSFYREGEMFDDCFRAPLWMLERLPPPADVRADVWRRECRRRREAEAEARRMARQAERRARLLLELESAPRATSRIF